MSERTVRILKFDHTPASWDVAARLRAYVSLDYLKGQPVQVIEIDPLRGHELLAELANALRVVERCRASKERRQLEKEST